MSEPSERERLLAKLRELRAVADGATAGPWLNEHGRIMTKPEAEARLLLDEAQAEGARIHAAACVKSPDGRAIYNQKFWDGDFDVAGCDECDIKDPDANFIALSRTLLPAMLTAAERQVEEHWPDEVEWCGGCEKTVLLAHCPILSAWCEALGVEESNG